MKIFRFVFLILVSFLASCSGNSPEGSKLSAPDFANKVEQTKDPIIIDVRTPEEFNNGHLENALNFDWNGDKFEQQISGMDKASPVFVYCLSGGRSSSAAQSMRGAGFKTVYELDGGILKWRAAHLPEASGNEKKSAGMSRQQFDNLLQTDQVVLIDFYADWCIPCKKMKPSLDQISQEMSGKVNVVRINVDENQALCNELGIDQLPTLRVYKNKTLTWQNIGLVEKDKIVESL